jgi:hypothetical protein
MLGLSGTRLKSPTQPSLTEWVACDRPLGIWACIWVVRAILACSLTYWGFLRERKVYVVFLLLRSFLLHRTILYFSYFLDASASLTALHRAHQALPRREIPPSDRETARQMYPTARDPNHQILLLVMPETCPTRGFTLGQYVPHLSLKLCQLTCFDLRFPLPAFRGKASHFFPRC